MDLRTHLIALLRHWRALVKDWAERQMKNMRFGFDNIETEPKPQFVSEPNRNRTVIQNIENAETIISIMHAYLCA